MGKPYRTVEQQAARTGMIMVLPSLIVLSVFVLYPIFQSFWMSLNDWNILRNVQEFNGISNYVKAFSDERFINAFWNTVYFTLLYVPLLVIISLLIAVLLSYEFFGTKLFTSLLFIPSITSMAIIAIIFRFLLDGDIGLVSLLLRRLGFNVGDLLRTPGTAMNAVIFTGLWRWIGFNMVIFLSGLVTIPSTLYEAAVMDGAGKIRQFFSITLPQLFPTISFVVITNIISSFQVFDQIYVMTKGGPMFSTEVLVYYIYYRGFNVFDMGYASAIAFILFLLIFVVTIFQLRSFTKSENEVSAG